MSGENDEVLRALGRVEGQLAEGARQRDDQTRKLADVGATVHRLANDITGFVRDLTEHARRITNLEAGMSAVAAMVNHGERIKALEEKVSENTDYIRAQKGLRVFLKWAFTAGCGAVGAMAAAWGLW